MAGGEEFPAAGPQRRRGGGTLPKPREGCRETPRELSTDLASSAHGTVKMVLTPGLEFLPFAQLRF